MTGYREGGWAERLDAENRALRREVDRLKQELYLLSRAGLLIDDLERVSAMAIDLLQKLEGVRDERSETGR